MVGGYIYKITCLTNGKMYIGQTIKPIEKRFRGHLRDAKNGSGYYLHSAIRKYGPENFTVEEVSSYMAETKKELKILLDEAEKKYIQEFNSFKNGYNLTLGGEGGLGRSVSEETRRKISEAQVGRPLSPEHLENLRRALANLPEESRQRMRENVLGRKASGETRKKLRESHLGHKPTPETLKKLKEVKAGTRPSDETLKAARKANIGRKMPDNVREALLNANKGRHLSAEHKRKIGEASSRNNRGRKLSEETKEKIRKAHLGKRGYKHSEETKRKISEAHRLRQEK